MNLDVVLSYVIRLLVLKLESITQSDNEEANVKTLFCHFTSGIDAITDPNCCDDTPDNEDQVFPVVVYSTFDSLHLTT